MPGARLLDGYAGTGAVGIEAMSRGAGEVTFVEHDRRARVLIAKNVADCGIAEGYAIIGSTVLHAIETLRDGPAFDIVFLDPPYASDIHDVLQTVGAIVKEDGIVIVEHARRSQPPAAAGALRRDARSAVGRQLAVDLRMSTLAVYPGSFDPLTNGHVDIIERGARLFDRIIVAILVNAEKAPLFSMAERVDIARKVFKDHANVEVDTFDGLLVDYVARRHANVLVRGLRAVSDFEYEFQMALMNRRLNPAIETVFMMPAEQYLVHQLPADQGSVRAGRPGARAGAGTGGNTPAGEAGGKGVASGFSRTSA